MEIKIETRFSPDDYVWVMCKNKPVHACIISVNIPKCSIRVGKRPEGWKPGIRVPDENLVGWVGEYKYHVGIWCEEEDMSIELDYSCENVYATKDELLKAVFGESAQ